MDGESRPPAAAMEDAASRVLGDDDLLIEILVRVGFPTTLVRAAAVCRSWYLHASDRRFLRRFRDRHPSRLLGFYFLGDDCSAQTTHFVPMLPQPQELAAVVRRISSNFDAYQRALWVPNYIFGCRNGRIVLSEHDRLGVYNMLCPPETMCMTMFPPRPLPILPDGCSYTYSAILSKEEEEEEGLLLSYWYLMMHSTMDGKYTMHVPYMLQDDAWLIHNLAIDQIPRPPSQQVVLVEDKIYMAAGQTDITVLDLTASSFSTIRLPKGVELCEGSTMLSRANDATSVYLLHLKGLQLRIWFHKGGTWSPLNSICLHDMCASLGMSDCNYLPQISMVGDNVEFVLLEMGRSILYLDVKCRTLRRVYELANEDRSSLGYIHPFMMPWPPVFPALKNGSARVASVEWSELTVFGSPIPRCKEDKQKQLDSY
ncbi:uncharacterized protein LOC125516366 [Triticum urartu]|uniref:uncharacterized protein LOC125516366 n=1 Tax=Triticum urartu TaxID=4572 RepID=UPI0020449A78|nr:uncharacterized protein LOC125516366 [Triticum urartu]